MARPACAGSAWPMSRSKRRASAMRARRCRTRDWSSPATRRSPSTWRRPTCPRTRGASTCRSRWASWPPAGRLMRRAWPAGSLPASCRCRASCGRCAARWPPSLALHGLEPPVRMNCCRRAAPRNRPGAQRADLRARHLLDVVRRFLPAGNNSEPEPTTTAGAAPAAGTTQRPAGRPRSGRCQGQAAAKRAEIAAAGVRLLLVGPPGSGKSMLAQRFARPAAAHERAAGAAERGHCQPGGRFTGAVDAAHHRQPHHSCSAIALVGGGSPPRARSRWRMRASCSSMNFLNLPAARWRPCASAGERAHHHIARGAARSSRARFQLIAAMNPAPAALPGQGQRACRCTPTRCATRASCPARCLDRIDLHVGCRSCLPPTC